MTAYAFEIEMAQNSNHSFFSLFSLRSIDHVSFCRSGSLFLPRKTEMAQNSNHFASNSISLRILSHLGFFELKKVSHFGKKTRDLYFEEKIKKK